MKTIFALILAPVTLLGQATNFPRLSGSNPTEDLGAVTYNIGTVRVYTGNGIPTSPTPLVVGVPPARGDYYLDVANTIFYICKSVTCALASDWFRVAYPTVVSVTAFGVNGSVSDAVNMQTAFTAASGNFCLYIPSGLTVNMSNNFDSVPNTCISGDGPTLSKVRGNGLAVPNVGMWDIQANDTNVSIRGIGFDGGVTTPAGVLYSTAAAGGAAQALFTTGSTLWVHSPASGINLDNILIQHTGGYAVFLDSSFGNIMDISIRNSTFKNNRPHLFGTSSGALNYGSWTGGILFFGNGNTYNYQNLIIDGNKWYNDTGHGVWFSKFTGTLASLNVRISNNLFQDMGLDADQVAWIDGYQEYGNIANRFGYVITSDYGATRVGGPLWLQNFTPVAYDTFGTLTSFVRSGNRAMGNGEMLDLDGAAFGSVTGNTFESCFISNDPLALSTLCGPSVAVGSNFTRGLTLSNSSGVGSSGTAISITGNSVYGVGNGGFVLFPCNYCVISGNTILYGAYPTNGSVPIVLGNINTSAGGHSTGNLVTANTINWNPPSGGTPAVLEDGTSICTCPFFATDNNRVVGNFLAPGFNNLIEFAKDANDASGTGSIYISSVTPGAPANWATIVQTEGNGSSTPATKFYASPNFSGTQIFQMSGDGAVPLTVNFAGLPVISSAGQIVYCTNCTSGSTPCSSGGTGHLAVTNGSQWNCN